MNMHKVQIFHWPLLAFTAAIIIIGLLNLYSASQAGGGTHNSYFLSQLAWVGVATLGCVLIFVIDYRIFERVAYFLYAAGIILLLAVFLTRPIAGSQRWLPLGAFNLQPSELMKIIIVITLAHFFHNDLAPREGYDLKGLFKPFALSGLAVLLILLEPDLGTAMMVAFIAGTICIFVKIRFRTILALILIAMIAMPVGWNFVMKDYQKKRVLTMLDPEADPRGSGYHRRQSVIAIGSGGFIGKGFTDGTQTQLRFLPEQHTDFIFSVWAEEQGFLGSFVLIGLYGSLILSGLHIASKAREKFGALLALGATAIIFWQVFINIGMVVGLLPVVGVTLPFMSYGGTSLVISMSCVAILLNIYSRKHMF